MYRIGLGYDIHRFTPGRTLVLGGVHIPHELGLEGHSDADVVLHALMDAMLGASSLGDIGQHFPPSDERFQDISSMVLLRHVCDLVAEAGYCVENADVVVVAEVPKIGPYASQMRRGIAQALGVEEDAVGIKATTNEEVGPEGRREAISAQAVALLRRDDGRR